MHIAHTLEDIPQLNQPIAMTIGNFDGVHLGHQKIIKTLRFFATPSGSTVVVTFENHPRHFFSPDVQIPLLSSLDKKIELLSRFNIDLLIILPFNQQLANLTYDQFLKKLRSYLPFTHLILGKGATLGKQRGGNEETITAFAGKNGFTSHFIEKVIIDGHEVSSGYIRTLLQKGDKDLAERLLGHPLN